MERPPYFSRSATAITQRQCLLGLILTGIAGLITGLLWNPTFPINKNLWTSSYVLYSAGWSLLTLALCYWLIDMRRLNETQAGKAILWPWLVFGSNAITAFVISNFLVLTLIWIKVPDSLSTTGKASHRLVLGLPPPLRPPRLHQRHLGSLRHSLRSRLPHPQLAPLAQTHLPKSLKVEPLSIRPYPFIRFDPC